ncbi:MAG TPA: hypothetical protein VNW23_08705 [Opitutaceae bacterium]|jgi:hypothetical protein|nr:hypothetical protein [Opitutaceae bacterium]
MDNTYQSQISTYLADLVTKTKQEQISWTKVNPTTFVANVPKVNARLTLQKTTVPTRIQVGSALRIINVVTYVLNLTDMQNNSVVLMLNVKENETSYGTLTELFNVIDDATKKTGAELLKRIVEG